MARRTKRSRRTYRQTPTRRGRSRSRAGSSRPQVVRLEIVQPPASPLGASALGLVPAPAQKVARF